MSINAGTLTIEIATNVARLQQDMAAAKKEVGGAMEEIKSSVEHAKHALEALGIALVAEKFVEFVHGAIEAKAKLFDLSIQTGISVEQLGGLAKVALYADTTIDEVAKSSDKMAKALFTQHEQSKGAADGIKALGLNFEQFRSMNAGERLVALAGAMEEFNDGTGKTAIAMELFGKNGAQMLVYLKELHERGLLVSKQSTESAAAAKEFADNLVTLKGEGEGLALSLANVLLPSLVSITNELNDGKKAYGSYAAAMLDVLSGSTVKGDLENTRASIDEINKAIERITKNGEKKPGLFEMFPDKPLAGLKEELALLEKRRAFQEAQQGRDALEGSGGVLDARDALAQRKKDLPTHATATDTKPIEDGYDSLMKKIREKTTLDQTELDLERKLTDSEKLEIDVIAEVDKNFSKLTLAKKLAIDGALQLALAVGKERDTFEANLKWMKEATDANATYLEAQMQLRDQMQLQARDAQLQIAQYGLTADELKALESARLRDAAAALEQKAALADSAYLEDNARLYREQASALRDTAAARDALAAKEAKDRNDPYAGADRAVKDYLADVKRAGDATYGAVANSMKGLEDLGVTALSGGKTKDAARQLVSGIISEFERLYIIKPLMASIFGGGSSGGGGGGFSWGSLIGGFAGLFGGSSYSANGGLGYASAAGISGGRAGGGDVDAGKNYLVGEKGPEILRMGSQRGSIVPNDQLGGGSVHIDASVKTLNVGQGVTRGEMASALQANAAQVEMRMRRLMRNGNLT